MFLEISGGLRKLACTPKVIKKKKKKINYQYIYNICYQIGHTKNDILLSYCGLMIPVYRQESQDKYYNHHYPINYDIIYYNLRKMLATYPL